MTGIFRILAPGFTVDDMESTLTFYTKLGFATMHYDESLAMIKCDGVDLSMNYSSIIM